MVEKQPNPSPGNVSEKRLWFGFVGAAAAWIVAGFLDVEWAGQGCPWSKASEVFPVPGLTQMLLIVVTFALLAVAILAGITSYRNWRKLTGERNFVEAEVHGRREFMAMFGVLVSLTLGTGIIWFLFPIFIITSCARAH